MLLLTSPEAAAMYERQATFMQLMDDYLSGRLSTEEYANARQQFFQDHFPTVHAVIGNHQCGTQLDGIANAQRSMPAGTAVG